MAKFETAGDIGVGSGPDAGFGRRPGRGPRRQIRSRFHQPRPARALVRRARQGLLQRGGAQRHHHAVEGHRGRDPHRGDRASPISASSTFRAWSPRASAGGAVKIVAVNYQKPPYCIFTLDPGANVTEPKQLANLEFGSSTSSFLPRIVQAFMEMNGVDSKTLKVVNIDGAARVPMLAARKIPSIDQFIMSEPAIRRAVTDAKPICLFARRFRARHLLELDRRHRGVSHRRIPTW